MASLEEEISAYEGMQQELESKSTGKWVLVHDRTVVGLFDTFEAAAEEAVKRFGRGPFLIRQIGAPPVTLPASVMYNVTNEKHEVRF